MKKIAKNEYRKKIFEKNYFTKIFQKKIRKNMKNITKKLRKTILIQNHSVHDKSIQHMYID